MKTNVFVNIIILEYVSAIEREYLFWLGTYGTINEYLYREFVQII